MQFFRLSTKPKGTFSVTSRNASDSEIFDSVIMQNLSYSSYNFSDIQIFKQNIKNKKNYF